MFYKCQIDYVLEWRATRTALKYGLTFSDKKHQDLIAAHTFQMLEVFAKFMANFNQV